ncbi:MAG: sialidase family protein, partial [Candidatus Sumerlaeota bacterium]|nr:sialidase family protein [Candidatus Sumerlaeota bacterium]
WILLSYNERPSDGVHPFAIKTCVSRDNGRAWSAPALVYEAGTDARTGCWEPAAIQLPSGEIQLFFANEFPYKKSNEQEISMTRSFDNGATWSAPIAVSFRPGHRDGMPSPLALRDGKGIVVAIEDNGLVRGPFKPTIVYSSLEDNWNLPTADGDSPRRWGALDPPLPPAWHAAAPCVRQMPSGETVLSFQIDRDASGAKHELYMAVCVGDCEAKHFGGMTYPFPLPPEQTGRWNSLFVKDDKTITAVSGTRINGQGGIWAIDGRIVRGS